jgi:hypothetical protein
VSDLPEKLIPARRDDLIATLAFALTRDSRLARMQSAELLASIVAERIVERLEASGYIVMRGPPAPGPRQSAAGSRVGDAAMAPSGAGTPAGSVPFGVSSDCYSPALLDAVSDRST